MLEKWGEVHWDSIFYTSFSSNRILKDVWKNIDILLSDYFVSEEVFNVCSQKEKESLFQRLILEFSGSELEYNLLWESLITGHLVLVCGEKEISLSLPFSQYQNYIFLLEAAKYHQHRKILFFKSKYTFH